MEHDPGVIITICVMHWYNPGLYVITCVFFVNEIYLFRKKLTTRRYNTTMKVPKKGDKNNSNKESPQQAAEY